MRRCTVKIQGITPYSCSRRVDEVDHPKKEKETAEAYDQRLWREHATTTPEGVVCIPAMAFKMATDEAIKRLGLQVPGRGKTTYSKFFVAGQLCEEDVALGVRKDDLEVISIWANADGVRGSGKRVKRLFPIINKWAGTAVFAILDDAIPAPVFERAFTEAGRLVGVGRFRPEKGGMNGRWQTEKFNWEEI